MPSNKRGLLAASQTNAGGAIHIEDLFTVVRYTGTGAALTVTTGIDLTGGGMVMCKRRDSAADFVLADTARGTGIYSDSSTADAESAGGVTAFNDGSVELDTDTNWNASGGQYTLWVFRSYPGFFDVITWSGDAVGGRTVAHSLGSTPKMFWIKRRNSGTSWAVYHSANTAGPETDFLELNSAAGTTDNATYWNDTAPDASNITLGTATSVNGSGGTFFGYLFGDDAAFGADSDESVMSFGSITTNGSGGWSDESIGWEPQLALLKCTSTTSGWLLYDTERGLFCDTTIDGELLRMDATSAASSTSDIVRIYSDGIYQDGLLSANADYVYWCIRRPTKTFSDLSLGVDDVCDAQNYIGSGATPKELDPGFKPDIAIIRVWWAFGSSASYEQRFYDRLRGGGMRFRIGDHAIQRQPNWNSFSYQDANFTVASGGDSEDAGDGTTATNHVQFLRRVPGYMDLVSYRGTGTAQAFNHSLGVAPDFIAIFNTTSPASIPVYHSQLNSGTTPEDFYTTLDNTAVAEANDATYWNDTAPTATQFTVGTQADVNGNTDRIVAFLLCNVAGVIDIGRYTGTGAAQTIDCGFSNGIKALWVKRIDAVGQWLMFSEGLSDGIVAGNDDYLTLSTNSVRQSGADYIDPDSSGFALTTNTTINTNTADYIYVAFAA